MLRVGCHPLCVRIGGGVLPDPGRMVFWHFIEHPPDSRLDLVGIVWYNTSPSGRGGLKSIDESGLEGAKNLLKLTGKLRKIHSLFIYLGTAVGHLPCCLVNVGDITGYFV